MENFSWSRLPDHILIQFFSYIPLVERWKVALVCKSWQTCFDHPRLWRYFKFRFMEPKDKVKLRCLDKYKNVLKSVVIELQQKEKENRDCACEVITRLARCKERKLQNITLNFVGQNPMFFRGGEFINALAELFGPPDPSCSMVFTLKEVDLSGMSVVYSDILFNLLADNHPNLEVLNILNTSLNCNTCTVKPYCILSVVKKCTKLRELGLFYCSISEEVLLELAEEGRASLQKLSVMCRREEKYGVDIPDSAWETLTKQNPNLKVYIAFDHTCPLHKIQAILQPHIPIKVLRLDTFTVLHNEVFQAAAYYSSTLEEVVVQGKPSADLNRALINLAVSSPNLRSLHCYCVLDKDTVDSILNGCPRLETYTLKTHVENHPWMPILVGRQVTTNLNNMWLK
ncbi:F-box/LRR-repeat protein 8-like [Saccoglossus kowalevskii]|uniref:F-box/LRR-repeat protein 8-like n=1 Tax=Saccoglossus kowalevskii TaxID=10224 RepID=A0ABM0GS72_SACKO|nr:PREDICTED: F-box/LRR-repeat protein 8-like [Saccoglossus kowalevskii]